MSNATTIDSLRVTLAAAEAHAAAAEESYRAYVDGPGDDQDGEHVVDYSIAADAAVEAAREALAEAIRASIEIGEVDEVYSRYEGGEELDLADMVDDLDYYVATTVTIDGVAYSVACGVGIQESEQSSARASGAGSSYGGGPGAWWVDSSDHQAIDQELKDGVLSALIEAAGNLYAEAEAICEEDLEGLRSKDNVTSWETVASYVATFPSDNGDGACDVEVQIGEARGAWYVRTTDDAGGSDEACDTRYETEQEAREAAEEYARDNHEADEAEDAEGYLRRQLEERAGEPSDDGEWCVYWATSLEDEHVVDRYETREQAEAASELANEALGVKYPGGLLCGYEVRRLVDSEWVAVGVEDDAA